MSGGTADATGTSRELMLGDFLRRRRGRLDPDALGVPSYGRRRVPGLRREEVALLAGVSVSYYTRIEQGTAGVVSPGVIRAIAEVLRLDGDDLAQLHRLAGLPGRASPGGSEQLDPGLATIMANLSLPAGVLSRSMRLLGWNHLGHRFFGPHLPLDLPSGDDNSWARVVFTDERIRALYGDWEGQADDLVGRLRAGAAHSPEDPALAAIVAELTATSPEFAALWAAHPARERPRGRVPLHHPEFGDLVFTDSVLHSIERDDQGLYVFIPEPGTRTEQVLRELVAQA